PAASYFGRRLRSLAAVELFPNYLALKAHIGFLPCVVYGSLTHHRYTHGFHRAWFSRCLNTRHPAKGKRQAN
ncbi:hypothetical protein, partial [Pseudomonas sp. PA-3-11C]